jgi:hypothetical protein
MKTKTAAFLLAAFALLTSACEQHRWDETKKLFKDGEHEHGKSEEHGAEKSGEAKH